MHKILFLDFDSVLNTEHYQGLLQYQGKPWQDEYGAFFDPKAVKQLKRILDSQLPHFILTNPYEGITEEQANRAISMLNE